MKIGVLTGGGDCSGLNAVIRAVTKSAMYHFGWQVVGIQDGFQGITSQPPNVHVLDLHEVSGILDRGGTILGASNRGDPFNYPMHDEDGKPLLDEEGKQIRQDISDRLAENMRSLGIKALVVVGGDGTMRLANRLHVEKGMNIVGVPKTIDNDLGGTDITFGFNTATQIVTDATDRLHSTAESHHRVMIIETMGRYAGHIALNAGLAGGADIILIPEIEWTVEKVAAVIKERRRMGRRHTIITVGEGAKPKGGQLVT
ncbi:6-phosphofructokinase, partial [bacterium]|nr:6-phosphofructokinase [bacterium]